MKLLSDINENVGKTAFQIYTVRHGFEVFQVMVPVKTARLFERKVSMAPTKQAVLTVLHEFGGRSVDKD